MPSAELELRSPSQIHGDTLSRVASALPNSPGLLGNLNPQTLCLKPTQGLHNSEFLNAALIVCLLPGSAGEQTRAGTKRSPQNHS